MRPIISALGAKRIDRFYIDIAITKFVVMLIIGAIIVNVRMAGVLRFQ